MNETYQQLNHAVTLVLPEVVLLATVCIMFFAAPFLVSERGVAAPGLRHRWGWLALIGIGVAGWLWWHSVPVPVGTGPFRLDALAWYVRGLALASGAILVLVNWNQSPDARAAESQACLLAIIAGVSLVGAANDLVMLFLALELISIPTYLYLLLPKKEDPAAQEATLKYFMLSAFSSAVLLFGLSYLYGVTGTTNLEAIYAALAAGKTGSMPPLLAVVAVMAVAGLGFRLTAVPFHFYAPDVFQGAPLSGAAMLSYVPKIAGFVALLRLALSPTDVVVANEWSLSGVATPMLWWIAVITMFLGNLLALLQDDLRRLLAFSSISHAGYMLIGFIVGDATTADVNGTEALLFYLAVYGAMTIGVFAGLAALSTPSRKIETIHDLAGLSRTNAGVAFMLAVFFFSLTGLPPTAGFLAKLNLFYAAWAQGTSSGHWLAIWLAVNAAIGAGYYLKVIGAMYLRDPVHQEHAQGTTPTLVALGLCGAAVIGLFFAPGWLWQTLQQV